jgi:hypothetical protein
MDVAVTAIWWNEWILTPTSKCTASRCTAGTDGKWNQMTISSWMKVSKWPTYTNFQRGRGCISAWQYLWLPPWKPPRFYLEHALQLPPFVEVSPTMTSWICLSLRFCFAQYECPCKSLNACLLGKVVRNQHQFCLHILIGSIH